MESLRAVVIVPSDPTVSAMIVQRLDARPGRSIIRADSPGEARRLLGKEIPGLAVVEEGQARATREEFSGLPVPLLIVGQEGESFDADGMAASIPAGLAGREDGLFDLLVDTMIELGRQQRNRALLESVVDAVEERIWITDAAGRIVRDNRAFREVWGPRSEGVSHEVMWVDPGEAGKLRMDAIGSGIGSSRETLHRHPSGETAPVLVRCTMLGAPGGAVGQTIWSARDIADEKRLDAVLDRLSGLDLVTGLPDERRFRETLDLEWRRAVRGGQHLAVLLVDPDNFRAYNQRYGRKSGDRCMTLLAGLLAGAPRRPGDLTARLEGAAIGIVLTGADTGAAEKFGARLCGQVHGLGIPHADAGIDGVVTVSIGLAASTATEGGRPVELIGRASEALLAAKSGGGNRVVASA
jgi:diguanylate cyclase (GGDEF)-like protein